MMFAAEILGTNTSPETRLWTAAIWEHFLHAQRGDQSSLNFFKSETWKYVASILFTENQRRLIEQKALEQKGQKQKRLRSDKSVAKWKETRAKTIAAKQAKEKVPTVTPDTHIDYQPELEHGVANVY